MMCREAVLLPLLRVLLPHTRTLLNTSWGALLAPGASAATVSAGDTRSADGANDEVPTAFAFISSSKLWNITSFLYPMFILKNENRSPALPTAWLWAALWLHTTCAAAVFIATPQVVAERILRELTREHLMLLAQLLGRDPAAQSAAVGAEGSQLLVWLLHTDADAGWAAIATASAALTWPDESVNRACLICRCELYLGAHSKCEAHYLTFTFLGVRVL